MEKKEHLQVVRQLSHWLDSAFVIPGTRIRFGFDPLIGLIPGLGDAVTAIISCYILVIAWQLQVSRWTLTRMAFNIALDSLLGAVPFFGDVFDVFWKSNEKNRLLLEREQSMQQAGSKDRFFIILLVLGVLGFMGLALWGTISLIQLLIAKLSA